MKEIIKPHLFEDAKQHIQSFSNRIASDLGIDKVNSSGGLFGLFNHNVTGDELNKITLQIQNYFIDFNSLHNDFIKEFGQVYIALESLDNEYIPAILGAVKGAEEASNQAKAAQVDIKKTIDTQKKVIDVLTEHKKKIDNSLNLLKKTIDEFVSYEHLVDIDTTWKIVEDHKIKIKNIENKFSDESKNIKQLGVTVSEHNNFNEKLEKQQHLFDIDNIWEISEILRKELDETRIQLKDNESTNLKIITMLKHNISIAYIIAGSAVGISSVAFILSLMRIING